MGPAVCEDFHIFFSRIFNLCQSTSKSCYEYLIEVLLRILSEFLAGPFLGSEFPLDAFNKFLDVLQPHVNILRPRLNLNPAVLISVVDHLCINSFHTLNFSFTCVILIEHILW